MGELTIFNNYSISRVVSYLILGSVIIGMYPRYTAILHWWTTYSFLKASFVIEGGDQVASILTFLLIPILLLDKRVNHWQRDKYNHSYYAKVIAFFSYCLIILQVSVIYFNASIGKLKVEEWSNGTAVYYWLNDSVFGLNYSLLEHINPILKSPIVVTLLTWGTLLIELSLALAVFGLKKEKICRMFLFIGVFLHFSFAMCFGLISFFFAMFGALLLYLIAKDTDFTLKFKP